MTDPHPPLSAILAESAPRLRRQSAAVTLRMWHHLTSEDASLVLFEPFRVEGRPYPLVDAILIAAATPDTSFALQLDALRIRSGQQALGDAFAAAVGDMLGANRDDGMIAAWRRVLDDMLDRIADRIEQRRA